MTFSDGEFNEANVRNAIEFVPYSRELGERLGIPASKLNDIDKLAPMKQKLKLVETLFRVDPDCNWTKLKATIKVLEWTKTNNNQRLNWHKSYSGSVGSISEDASSGTSAMSGIVFFHFVLALPHACSLKSIKSVCFTILQILYLFNRFCIICTYITPEIDESELLATKAISRKNTALIRKNYSKLIMKITGNLMKVDLNMSDFRHFVIHLFDAGGIPTGCSVRDVFNILTEKRYWNFIDVTDLESIVGMFSGGFEDENMKLIKEYRKELAGFKIAIKMTDFIRENGVLSLSGSEEYTSIMADTGKYDDQYRKKLSLKLDGGKGRTKIFSKSLQYIEKLWNSLCDEFDMPSLSKLLDSIVKGSIVITWLVRCVHARKILDKINSAVEFLMVEFIVQVSLESVCIYDEHCGVADLEVHYCLQ